MSPARNVAGQPGSAPGYRIGRYRVRARLGKGGMGVVYLGRDEALDRDVAVKTLRVEGSPDDESRGRFEIEAKAAARLQHPNIVTVFELGEDRGLPYIAMELLGGQDLETLLRKGDGFSASERVDIVIQMLRGLDFAHAHHIVHRDIKPSNIRVLDDGGVKILDFGIAKVESASVTRAGMMVGTPFYMSPEHIRGGTLDGRSDVFAVGVILHELFALKRPFVADDPTRILYRIVNEPHPRLGADAAGAQTADIQRVIDKALEKDADARYSSAGQMADDLVSVRDRMKAPPLPAHVAAALSQARKRVTGGEIDPDLVQTVEAIARAHPEAAEAQRLLRACRRRPEEPIATSETASFPELDATFARAERGDETVLSGQTVNGRAETISQHLPAAPASGSSSKVLVFGTVALALLTGLVAGLLYLNQTPVPKVAVADPPPPFVDATVPPKPPVDVSKGQDAVATDRQLPATKTTTVKTNPTAVSATRVAVEIRSQPLGAAIRLDRRAVGVTPQRIQMSADVAHILSLSLDGYQPKELRLDVPLPPSVDAILAPNGPPATLVVESAYPVTVSASGRVIFADKQGATATLPAGSYEVVIESPSLFLKHRETVRLEGGASATLRAPSVGKIGVRASPDNCKVSIDGVFVDYPPILDRAIAAGSHVVSFEWPDGARSEERIQIQAGKPSLLLGRKP